METLSFATSSLVSDPGVEKRSPTHKITFSIGGKSGSRKSPNDAPWEKVRQKLGGRAG